MKRSYTLAAALLCAACTSAKKQPGAPVADTTVKILNFYARESDVTEGTSTVLCYAVENAKTVSMDPPSDDGVWPSRNRCVEVRPRHETVYKLQAEGNDGRTVTQALNVGVRTDAEQLPKISFFSVESCSRDYANKAIFKLGFAAGNVGEVSIDPPVFQTLHGSPAGEFYVTPDKNTTYTLTVTGKHGHAVKQQVSVDISKCR